MLCFWFSCDLFLKSPEAWAIGFTQFLLPELNPAAWMSVKGRGPSLTVLGWESRRPALVLVRLSYFISTQKRLRKGRDVQILAEIKAYRRDGLVGTFFNNVSSRGDLFFPQRAEAV